MKRQRKRKIKFSDIKFISVRLYLLAYKYFGKKYGDRAFFEPSWNPQRHHRKAKEMKRKKTARHPIGKPRRRSDSSEQKDDIRPNGTGFRESGLAPEQNERMNTEWTDTDKTEKTARFSL